MLYRSLVTTVTTRAFASFSRPRSPRPAARPSLAIVVPRSVRLVTARRSRPRCEGTLRPRRRRGGSVAWTGAEKHVAFTLAPATAPAPAPPVISWRVSDPPSNQHPSLNPRRRTSACGAGRAPWRRSMICPTSSSAAGLPVVRRLAADCRRGTRARTRAGARARRRRGKRRRCSRRWRCRRRRRIPGVGPRSMSRSERSWELGAARRFFARRGQGVPAVGAPEAGAGERGAVTPRAGKTKDGWSASRGSRSRPRGRGRACSKDGGGARRGPRPLPWVPPRTG